MSEIDDIFACKGKETVAQYVTSSSSSSKKKKKKKRPPTAMPKPVPEFSKKRKLPDTIVDTSHERLTLRKRRKKEKFELGNPEGNPEDVATFKDSRSNTGQKITEEGWRVYKEDELGINNQGGDTELCPFDCNCCF